MDVVTALLIVSMGVVSLELATDGAWRTGHWHPHMPPIRVSVLVRIRLHFRHHEPRHHVIRIVGPHPPVAR